MALPRPVPPRLHGFCRQSLSRDAGLTWRATALDGRADFHAMAVWQAGGVIALAVHPDGGELLLSEDGGASWTALDLPRPGETVTHIAIHPASEGVMYLGTAADNLFVTEDSGRTWRQLAEGGVPAGT